MIYAPLTDAERIELLRQALHVALSYVEPQSDPAAIEAIEGCRYVYADECDRTP